MDFTEFIPWYLGYFGGDDGSSLASRLRRIQFKLKSIYIYIYRYYDDGFWRCFKVASAFGLHSFRIRLEGLSFAVASVPNAAPTKSALCRSTSTGVSAPQCLRMTDDLTNPNSQGRSPNSIVIPQGQQEAALRVSVSADGRGSNRSELVGTTPAASASSHVPSMGGQKSPDRHASCSSNVPSSTL